MKRKDSFEMAPDKSKLDKKALKCQHKNTVAINEEGLAGIFCADCGYQLEKEC